MAKKLNKGVIYLKSITGINGPTYRLHVMSQRTNFSDHRQIILKSRVFARSYNVKFCSGKSPVHIVLLAHYSLIFVWCVICQTVTLFSFKLDLA